MQSARPQAPEATLVVRTSKALAQALRTGGDLKLDLSPEQLGRIQVRMNSTEQGMAVVLACQEPHAAQTLERSLPELQRSLEAQGVHATSVRVCLMDGAVDVNPAGTQLPDAQDRGASTTAQGESGTKGRHESTRRGADSAAPAGREDEGELWEVDSRLGTVIASVPVAGITRAVDMTV